MRRHLSSNPARPGKRTVLALSVAVALTTTSSHSLAATFNARLQLQQQQDAWGAESLASQLGYPSTGNTRAEARLMTQDSWGRWQGTLHCLADWQHGSGVALNNQLSDAGISDVADTLDNTDWWHLSHRNVDGTRTRGEQRLDRLWLGYTGQQLVFRFGRQALTWGSGQVFHPMDIFDPFSPTTTDTDYKRGTDMVYGQWLFDDGSDVQGILVPRRAAGNEQAIEQRSSAAVHWHRVGERVQSNALLAQDYGDTVLGASLSGPVGGATWSLEAVPTVEHREAERHGRVAVSFDAVLSNAFMLRSRNATGFVEYYRNGFGVSGRGYTLRDLPVDLQWRLDRGQVFNTGRNYLAVGGTLEWTPLVEIAPTIITNLRDRSAMALVTVTDSLRQNTDLILGVQVPVGPSGSEFGGLETAPGSGVYAAPARELNLRLNQYF